MDPTYNIERATQQQPDANSVRIVSLARKRNCGLPFRRVQRVRRNKMFQRLCQSLLPLDVLRLQFRQPAEMERGGKPALCGLRLVRFAYVQRKSALAERCRSLVEPDGRRKH